MDMGADAEPVYVISVVSRMLQMHPQTLRKYERAGFVQPSRSGGMLRLYSDEDVRRLRLIKHLVDDFGLNLAGVELILHLRERMDRIHERLRGPDITATEALDLELNELFAALEEDS
jgi:MerR family transcriptional regulator, heat shock protein HspR